MLADAEVARFVTMDGRPQDAAAAWRITAMLVGHWAIRGYGMFAIEERATGAFVGRVGPWRPEGWPGLEIGWALTRDAWGKGYATEAAIAAGAWTFETLGAESLMSLIHVENIRSQNVARRLGARLTAPTLHAGQPHTIWRTDRADWPLSPNRQ
jgi:RimJ/RimL family protein N-acetyltransferase